MQSVERARERQEELLRSPRAGQVAAKTSSAARPSHAKNRGRIDVIADMLNCCRSKCSKSHIMLFANVNSIVATRMIEKLTETGLMDSVHEEDSVVYLATPKGAGFVAKYIELQKEISPELVPVESKTNNPNRLNSLNF